MRSGQFLLLFRLRFWRNDENLGTGIVFLHKIPDGGKSRRLRFTWVIGSSDVGNEHGTQK